MFFIYLHCKKKIIKKFSTMTEEEKKNLREIFSHKTMYGELIMTIDIDINDENVFGDDETHTLEFDVWDGFAYCYDYEGHEYFMTYPKKSLINLSMDMSDTIRTYLTLDKGEKIEPIHILTTYNKLFKAK